MCPETAHILSSRAKARFARGPVVVFFVLVLVLLLVISRRYSLFIPRRLGRFGF